MEKKYFLIIPLFFLIYSFLFPIPGGDDRYLKPGNGIAFQSQPKLPELPGRECTSCASASGIYALGFLDGTVMVDGVPLEDQRPGTYQTVYALALSSDAEYLAVIAGLYPQSLSVYQKKQESYNLVQRIELSDSVRSNTFMAFSDNMLMYEDAGGISLISMTTSGRFTMEFAGALKGVAYDSSEDHVWVLAEKDDGSRFIHLFLYDGSLVASLPYSGQDKFLPFHIERH